MIRAFGKTITDGRILGHDLSRVRCQGKDIWTSGIEVTYVVGNDRYVEKVKKGTSVLNPTSFTPTISEWNFVGWREDTTASASVLTNKIANNEPITLYAVFSQNVDLYTVANGTTSVVTKQKYYNTGNNAYPTFTVTNPTKSGATFNGWSASASSTAVSWPSVTNLTLVDDTFMYAVFTYANSVILNVTGYYETGYTDSMTIAYNADMYYGLTFSNIWLRTGSTNTSGSNTAYLKVGGVTIATATSSQGIGYNKNLGTYDLSSLRGTVTVTTEGTNWNSLVCESGTGTITALGRTVVG